VKHKNKNTDAHKNKGQEHKEDGQEHKEDGQSKEHKEDSKSKEHKEDSKSKGHKEDSKSKERQKEHKDHKDHKDHKEHKDHKDHKDHKEHRDKEDKEVKEVKSKKFSWSQSHDKALLQEILIQKPYAQDHGKVFKVWEDVASALNFSSSLGFNKITGQACTKRFSETLLKRHKKESWESYRASGIEEDVTDIKALMEEIQSDIDDTSKQVKVEREKEQQRREAEEEQERKVRSMATLSKREKKDVEALSPAKKEVSKNGTTELLEMFLTQKAEESTQNKELKKLDLEIKKAQLAQLSQPQNQSHNEAKITRLENEIVEVKSMLSDLVHLLKSEKKK